MLESTRFYDPAGDVFLQTTTDQSVFQISSALLSLISDTFADIFIQATAQDPPEGQTADAPINLEHSSGDVFAAVCQIVYPGENPPLHEDLPLLVKCIQFAERYDLDTLTPIFQGMICHPYLLDAQPFHVYGLACDFHWATVKDKAAKATLIYDVDNIRLVPGFGKLSAQDYHELVTLHRLKAEKMRSILRILTNSRYLAPGVKCVPAESANEEEDFTVMKEKRVNFAGVGLKNSGGKPIVTRGRSGSAPKAGQITVLKDSGKTFAENGIPPPSALSPNVPEARQIVVNHFWESKRCKCNAHAISTDVADQDYDSVTPQWLQQFLMEASYTLLPVPTVEKLNKLFAHNAGVRCALNSVCVACPVNAREHAAELLHYKRELMKAFHVE